MSLNISFTSQRILHIALPSIVSNITVPLLGLVDVTIVGHLGSASYIGAIAIGGMLFNMIYWIFGFLRMGTSGLTAQSYGAHDLPEVTRILLRSLGISLLLALALLVLQYPIRIIAFHLIDASPEVRELASLYFHICIWGAPATLGLYGFTGWFIGMQNSRFPMFIAIAQKRGKHCRQPVFRVCLRYESGRSSTWNPHCPIRRTLYGIPAVVSVLPSPAQICQTRSRFHP